MCLEQKIHYAFCGFFYPLSDYVPEMETLISDTVLDISTCSTGLHITF